MEVMVVEDDPTTRMFICKWLASKGHKAVEFADGLAALAAYKARPVQVVLTDWMMPELDGLQLCQAIRELNKPKYTFIIMLTSKGSHQDLVEALDAGVDDFMRKPVQVDELSARLKVAERIIGLQNHLRQMETLLPTCMYCKKIRNEKQDWLPIEQYISEKTGTDFSHGVCPECYERVMGEYRAKRQSKD